MQFPHAGAEAQRIERIDGKGSMAALRATATAGEPIARTPSGIRKRRIHDLNELLVAGGKLLHDERIDGKRDGRRGRVGFRGSNRRLQYLELQGIMLSQWRRVEPIRTL